MSESRFLPLSILSKWRGLQGLGGTRGRRRGSSASRAASSACGRAGCRRWRSDRFYLGLDLVVQGISGRASQPIHKKTEGGLYFLSLSFLPLNFFPSRACQPALTHIMEGDHFFSFAAFLLLSLLPFCLSPARWHRRSRRRPVAVAPQGPCSRAEPR